MAHSRYMPRLPSFPLFARFSELNKQRFFEEVRILVGIHQSRLYMHDVFISSSSCIPAILALKRGTSKRSVLTCIDDPSVSEGQAGRDINTLG
jgi:hypothetical protein